VPRRKIQTRIQSEDRLRLLEALVEELRHPTEDDAKPLILEEGGEGETRVPVVMLTNRAVQARVDAAVQAIEALDTIRGDIMGIRVETLDG